MEQQEWTLGYGSFRRWFARLFDIILYGFLWKGIVYGIFQIPLFLTHYENGYEGLGIMLISMVLMLFIEPLFLCLWRTTPGKWFFGLRVQKVNGGRLTYFEGLKRTFLMLVLGMGLYIPVFSQIRWFLSFKRANAGEEMPWETDGKSYIKHRRMWIFLTGIFLAAALAVAGVFFEFAVIDKKGCEALSEEWFVEPNQSGEAKYHLIFEMEKE